MVVDAAVSVAVETEGALVAAGLIAVCEAARAGATKDPCVETGFVVV